MNNNINQPNSQLRKNVTKELLMKNTESYFNMMYDESLKNQKVKVKFTTMDGEEREMNHSEFKLHGLIENVILTLNGKLNMPQQGLEITRDNLKSIEIIFK